MSKKIEVSLLDDILNEVQENLSIKSKAGLLKKGLKLIPKLRFELGRQKAEAKKDLRNTEVELRVFKAQESQLFRQQSEKMGVKRPTVDQIKESYRTQERYIFLNNQITDLEFKVDILGTALDSLDDKKDISIILFNDENK